MRTTRIAAVRDRILAGIVPTSRIDEYRTFLLRALDRGYRVCSISELRRCQAAGDLPQAKTLVLRHDVDSDAGTAADMWALERSLGIAGSYFFRLCTLDQALMCEIAAAGGDASYHYEELADVVKQRRLRTRDEALAAIPEARERFRANVALVRSKTGLPISMVASHGDWANRVVAAYNWEILADAAFRKECGIELEVYDSALTDLFSIRFSDGMWPQAWQPSDPTEALTRGFNVVHLLVHPRHWRASPASRLLADTARAYEAVRYRCGRPRPVA